MVAGVWTKIIDEQMVGENLATMDCRGRTRRSNSQIAAITILDTKASCTPRIPR
jgi:hypothetical protein